MSSERNGSSIIMGKLFIVMLHNGLTGCQNNSCSNSSFTITHSSNVRLNLFVKLFPQ